MTLAHNDFSFVYNRYAKTDSKRVSLFDIVKSLYKINKYINNAIKNFDAFCIVSALDSVDSIENMLDTLEKIKDELKEIVSAKHKWYMRPFLILVNAILDNIVFLEGLLTAREADIVANR